jgi:hypothetical protein
MTDIFGPSERLLNFHTYLLVLMEENVLKPIHEQKWAEPFVYYSESGSTDGAHISNETVARTTIKDA